MYTNCISHQRVVILAFLWVIHGCYGQERLSRSSQASVLSIEIPSHWRGDSGGSGIILFSFSTAESIRAAVVPDDGCVVLLYAGAKVPFVEKWRSGELQQLADLTLEDGRLKLGTTLTNRHRLVEMIGGVELSAIEQRTVNRSVSESSRQRLVTRTVFFILNGEAVRASISYWNIGVRAAEYEQNFDNILRSLRLLPLQRTENSGK